MEKGRDMGLGATCRFIRTVREASAAQTVDPADVIMN
jgi:hypothetical protein